MSAGGERPILGATAVAASVSLPVLSDLPPVRQDPVPGAYRPAVLGHRLCTAGSNCDSRRAAVRSRSPVHRGALRRLAHVPHYTTTPYRHATDRTAVTKHRVGSHRRGIQGGRQCAQVWNLSLRCWRDHLFSNSPVYRSCVSARMFDWLVCWFVRGLLDRSFLSHQSAGYGPAPHNWPASLERSVITTLVGVPNDTQFHCMWLQLPLRFALLYVKIAPE